jgi:glycosyltransferase involved in cell wall biosynthesis
VQTLDPSVGGVGPAVLALSHGLARRGHKVDIVTLDASYSSHMTNLTVHPLGSGLTSYRYSRKLVPWLREHGRNYDRVIVNGLWQYLSFAAWQRYAGTSTPYYVFPHGMLDPWFKRTYPLKHLKKWLYWPWADYRVLRDAASVIFTSEEERLQARKSFWLYRCRETVSPLGLEPPPALSPEAREMFLNRHPSLRSKRLLLFLGRLHPKKGCDLLIESFASIWGTHAPSRVVSGAPAGKLFGAANAAPHLVLAGPCADDSYLRQLKQIAADSAAPITFTGMLQGEMKQAALACADAFILPSHQENFGMSVVESLASSLPVLISNRVNIWREIDADRAGYVDNDDLAGTTRLIERWLGTPEHERTVMRTNAHNCFVHRYQIDRAIDSLLEILRSIDAK